MLPHSRIPTTRSKSQLVLCCVFAVFIFMATASAQKAIQSETKISKSKSKSSTTKAKTKTVIITPDSASKKVSTTQTLGRPLNNRPHYIMTVTQGGKPLGTIEIELFPDIAPKHCAHFDELVAENFYDGTAFHRVIPGFMIQGGDPNTKNGNRETWGTGAPGQKTVTAEFNATPHRRGIISAARTNDPNSATSQFFLCVADSPWLDGQYTVYGEVVKGMEVADVVVNSPRDARDCPNEKIEMTIVKR